MAGSLNLIIEQGTTFYKKLILSDNNDKNIDLTGYTAKMQIRTCCDGEIIASSLSDPVTIIIDITPLDSMIEITILDEITANFENSKVVYDLVIESSSGFVTRLLEGSVTISKEVTR